MKVAAHPLVVAVALGLVAPSALEVVEDDERTAACDGCTAATVAPELAASPAEPSYWDLADAPSDDDFHQVEIAWLKARENV